MLKVQLGKRRRPWPKPEETGTCFQVFLPEDSPQMHLILPAVMCSNTYKVLPIKQPKPGCPGFSLGSTHVGNDTCVCDDISYQTLDPSRKAGAQQKSRWCNATQASPIKNTHQTEHSMDVVPWSCPWASPANGLSWDCVEFKQPCLLSQLFLTHRART